jgi:probable rRNA maturation factor
MDVTVIDRQRGRRISTTGLGRFLRRLARAAPSSGADRVAVCLVSDRAMAKLNAAFRGRRGPTDVLSFPAGDAPLPEGGRHLGDVVIAVPTAAAQARRAGHGLARELKILALHGYLHLLGYDHEVDDGDMRRLERRLTGRLLAAPPRRGIR